jgi:hypothetical protein
LEFSPIFEDAEFLAKFANLELDRLESFRQDYPDFFPPAFWIAKGPDVSINRWVDPNSDLTLHPLTMARLVQGAVQDMWQNEFPFELSVALIGLGNGVLNNDFSFQTYPYQRAVMFLHNGPWRAKICEGCGGLYVADHPLRKYCSVASENRSKCSEKAIQKSRNKWWENVGKQRRTAKAVKGGK